MVHSLEVNFAIVAVFLYHLVSDTHFHPYRKLVTRRRGQTVIQDEEQGLVNTFSSPTPESRTGERAVKFRQPNTFVESGEIPAQKRQPDKKGRCFRRFHGYRPEASADPNARRIDCHALRQQLRNIGELLASLQNREEFLKHCGWH